MQKANKIQKIARKSDMILTPDGKNINARSGQKLTQADIKYIQANKPAFIMWIAKDAADYVASQAKYKARREGEYNALAETLPERNFKNTPDQEKFDTLISTLSSVNFDGPEDDGLAMSVAASNCRIKAESQKYCDHELKKIRRNGFTADARLKVEREISCVKCGLHVRDEVSEPVESW